MIALFGLLASGALFKSDGTQPPTTPQPHPAPADEGTGGLHAGLGGLLERFQQNGQAWIGSGEKQPVQPGQLAAYSVQIS
jgi:uncharacterized protein YidB (DUF937 family)